MSDTEKRLEAIKEGIKSYEDFPKPGVLFRDVFPVLRQPNLFRDSIQLLIEHVQEETGEIDAVVGLDSRGFIFGSVLAYEMKKPFVPIRKKGKLPGLVKEMEFKLEYGSDTFEAQVESISPGQKVVIVDDLLATGGTMVAAVQLVRSMGGKVAEAIVIVELTDLKGRFKIPDVQIYSLLQY